jgi:hypothetical protein
MKRAIMACVLFIISFSAKAQFFNAMGAAAGISYGKEGWSEEQWATQEKYYLRFNGAILAEFFDNPVYKWRSEFMYNQLGTQELVVANKFTNATTYISFNNYLKYQHEFFKFMPYVLIGPRIAYLFSRSASVFQDAIGGMYTIHISAAAGAGVELVSFSRFKPFVEIFYNHDVMPSFSGTVASTSPFLNKEAIPEVINNHDYELRIGLKYVFRPRDKCPHVDNSAGGHFKNGIQ